MERRTIDIQDGDAAWIEQFYDDVDSLTGLVEEAFETRDEILLSPVLRRLIRDHGRKVKAKLKKVHYRLCVDNPAEPLSAPKDQSDARDAP